MIFKIFSIIVSLLSILIIASSAQDSKDGNVEILYSFLNRELNSSMVIETINQINSHVGFRNITGTRDDVQELEIDKNRKNIFNFFRNEKLNSEKLENLIQKVRVRASRHIDDKTLQKGILQSSDGGESQMVLIYHLIDGSFYPEVISELLRGFDTQAKAFGVKLVLGLESESQRDATLIDFSSQKRANLPDNENSEEQGFIQIYAEFEQDRYDPIFVNDIVNEINNKIGLAKVDENQPVAIAENLMDRSFGQTIFYHLPEGYNPSEFAQKLRPLNIPQKYKEPNGNFAIFYHIAADSYDKNGVYKLVRELDSQVGDKGKRELYIFETKSSKSALFQPNGMLLGRRSNQRSIPKHQTRRNCRSLGLC